MRIGFLSPLALALLAGLSVQAQASSDDSCYPDWRVSRDTLDPCSNQPFLSPGNDSRVNLRMLLADKKNTGLTPNALSEDDLAEGFGPVPFPVYRLTLLGSSDTEPDDGADTSSTAELDNLLQPLGIKREDYTTAGEAFVTGEGSRCRSNDDDSATAFVRQVVKADMPAAEREECMNVLLSQSDRLIDALVSTNVKSWHALDSTMLRGSGGRFPSTSRAVISRSSFSRGARSCWSCPLAVRSACRRRVARSS